jgi:hypothetical protein
MLALSLRVLNADRLPLLKDLFPSEAIRPSDPQAFQQPPADRVEDTFLWQHPVVVEQQEVARTERPDEAAAHLGWA